jgi:hypothetical protein
VRVAGHGSAGPAAGLQRRENSQYEYEEFIRVGE